MKTLTLITFALSVILHTGRAAEPVYDTGFESTAVGEEPEGFLVIDGQFAVREFEGGKVFELPGSPLETFGFVFGPNFGFNDAGNKFKLGAKPDEAVELAGLTVTARVYGTKKGRRYPAFSIGLCGVGGYKLRVAPMKRAVELVKGDETVASTESEFASGAWTRLKLRVRSAEGKWITEGRVWKDGDPEPATWQVTYTSTDKPNPGKASAWAAPFSGQPIRFDDLVIEGAN